MENEDKRGLCGQQGTICSSYSLSSEYDLHSKSIAIPGMDNSLMSQARVPAEVGRYKVEWSFLLKTTTITTG